MVADHLAWKRGLDWEWVDEQDYEIGFGVIMVISEFRIASSLITCMEFRNV